MMKYLLLLWKKILLGYKIPYPRACHLDDLANKPRFYVSRYSGDESPLIGHTECEHNFFLIFPSKKLDIC